MTSPDLRPDGTPRRPLRPLHGIPEPEKRDRTGWVISALFHGAIILAMILPTLIAKSLIEEEQQGAGGAGPAGGGGGGNSGTGGRMDTERLRYVQLQAAPAPAPSKIPTPAPVPPKAPDPEPVAPTPVPPAETAAPPAAPAIATDGTGGGSGTDGSAGNGPGRGGGIGSGEGTGRGSGNGPGTGGGGDQIYPPMVTNMPILPLPVPNRIRPYRMVASFDVDERGNARLLGFNPSRDAGYNRKVREMLAEVRFRPATRADGTPVRDTAFFIAEAPR